LPAGRLCVEKIGGWHKGPDPREPPCVAGCVGAVVMPLAGIVPKRLNEDRWNNAVW